MNSFKISASLLSADFAQLGKETTNALAAGADWIHMDVMDNHYVPNLTIGPLVCAALRDHGITAPLDVHLMVNPVDRLIQDFAKAGATYITIHPEASHHLDRSLQLIRDLGCKAGLAFNPGTPINYLEYLIEKLDCIMIMSVNPGFSNQHFIPSALNKIKAVRQFLDQNGCTQRLEVDGGVKIDNIKEIGEAGVDTFVIGSAIFDTEDYTKSITAFRSELSKITHQGHH